MSSPINVGPGAPGGENSNVLKLKEPAKNPSGSNPSAEPQDDTSEPEDEAAKTASAGGSA